jgi:peptidoglycan/xylan/chitin deacetylase (PgdA/CDA1 family)
MLRRALQALNIRATRAFPAKPKTIRLDRPVASITFDDFAKNAWTAGGSIVEQSGGRATYYLSGSFCGKTIGDVVYYDEADLAALHARGHEAACHSFDHGSVCQKSGRDLMETLRRNAGFVKDAIGTEMTSFAYPYGAASIRTKLLLRNRFAACRGIEPGINAGRADFAQLRAVCLQPHFLADYPVDRLIEAALRSNGWLIFIGHDVSDSPTPYGCTPAVLEDAVSRIKAAGMEILTVNAVLERTGAVSAPPAA